MTRVLWCLLVLAVLLSSCVPQQPHITLKGPDGANVDVTVEIADEPAEHAQGMMGRSELPSGYGMLFLFPEQRTLSFWMKNTLIPLDVLFFDAEGHYVSSHTMVPCTEEPCLHYNSAGSSLYALEVPAGFREEHGIGVGWKLVGM